MKPVVIENPILNSPYVEPQRHFRFAEDGITDEIVAARRISQYFIPIAPPKKKGPKQYTFETEWTADRIEENKFINRVRERVALWRRGGYPGITRTTARLLEYWQRPDRERKLFFCQIEALETAIYITEVAGKYGDAWIENELHRANADANPLLYRISGDKTYVSVNKSCGTIPRGYFRPRTGAIVQDAGQRSGLGKLTVDNGTQLDGVVVLALLSDVPLAAVYIRSGESFTLAGIRDGSYRLFFTTGEDWDGDEASFAKNPRFQRFEDQFNFKTVTTAQGLQYTTWSVTLHPTAGGIAATLPLRPDQFPDLK